MLTWTEWLKVPNGFSDNKSVKGVHSRLQMCRHAKAHSALWPCDCRLKVIERCKCFSTTVLGGIDYLVTPLG